MMKMMGFVGILGGIMDETDITGLLKRWRAGDRTAFDTLIELTQGELKKIAHWRLKDEYRHSGLQTTELLNEACIVLMGKPEIDWQSRKHFFHMAGLAMHRFLVDEARKSRTAKHGGHLKKLTFSDERLTFSIPLEQFLQIDEVLNELDNQDPLLVQIVKLRFTAGFTIKETAEVLELPTVNINRKWSFAKALLQSRLTVGG